MRLFNFKDVIKICLYTAMLSIPSTTFFTLIQIKQYVYQSYELVGTISAVVLILLNILFMSLLIYIERTNNPNK